MKRALILGAMALGVLAIPSSAAAESDCSYATGTTQTVGPVTVYADVDGNAGTTGTAAAAAGACADGIGVGGFDGGFAEVGAGEDPAAGAADPGLIAGQPDAYAVVDGSDANVDPAGQSDGYVGVSNYETGGTRTSAADCAASGPDNGSAGSSNSGGCVGIDGVAWVAVPADLPTPMCGNSSGNAFDGNGDEGLGNRDGCSLP